MGHNTYLPNFWVTPEIGENWGRLGTRKKLGKKPETVHPFTLFFQKHYSFKKSMGNMTIRLISKKQFLVCTFVCIR